MFGDGSLTLREFARNDPLPLARIQDAVLQFLRHRQEAVLFGAQAVNAYVDESRMTPEVDILSTRAAHFSEELAAFLTGALGVAVFVHKGARGRSFRLHQVRQPKNRRLVHVRQVARLPPTRTIADIRVPTPEELIAQKVISAARRCAQPKGDTDRRDLKVLLLAHSHLKSQTGPVFDRLSALNADKRAKEEWRKLVESEIQVPEPEDSIEG